MNVPTLFYTYQDLNTINTMLVAHKTLGKSKLRNS